ncbi:hypothetical protein EZV73_22980 [Acidaminobacter sp. JC074]|uniref:hypothetical protein n=1 Tax=Acidaminobacter sp. JC074 TaxID=2530199 RepID=UPI001F1095EF|nr:hypothetical protein [Acidaminobacter sp. JC074]MCH4890463.1 hypothetical protein [Acidaminobacter sp. JC074]
MSKRDKIMILVMIGLVILLLVKSLVLDPYQVENEAEEAFLTYVEKLVDERYSGGLYGTLVQIKVVNITEMSEREKSYKDLDGNVQVTQGTYKAKIRKYILGILPYAEESILEGVEDES